MIHINFILRCFQLFELFKNLLLLKHLLLRLVALAHVVRVLNHVDVREVLERWQLLQLPHRLLDLGPRPWLPLEVSLPVGFFGFRVSFEGHVAHGVLRPGWGHKAGGMVWLLLAQNNHAFVGLVVLDADIDDLLGG